MEFFMNNSSIYTCSSTPDYSFRNVSESGYQSNSFRPVRGHRRGEGVSTHSKVHAQYGYFCRVCNRGTYNEEKIINHVYFSHVKETLQGRQTIDSINK